MTWRVTPLIGAVARALLTGIVLLVACTFVVFALQQAAGVDPAAIQLGVYATPEELEQYRQSHGLNDPFFVQYVRFLGEVLRLDLGASYFSGQPVSLLITDRIGLTATLLVLSFLFSLIVSIALALLGAIKPGGVFDRIGQAVAVMATVMPVFWVGIMLILLIAIPTGVFPVGGVVDGIGGLFLSLTLPAMTLGLQLVPVQLRALRGSLAQQMGSAYVEAARSRGVGQVRLVLVHALPNSYGALIAILGVQVGWSMFLAVVVESTFRIPGIGQGLILAAKQSDIPVVNATTLVLVAVVIAASVVTNWLAKLVDPKQRRPA